MTQHPFQFRRLERLVDDRDARKLGLGFGPRVSRGESERNAAGLQGAGNAEHRLGAQVNIQQRKVEVTAFSQPLALVQGVGQAHSLAYAKGVQKGLDEHADQRVVFNHQYPQVMYTVIGPGGAW